MKAILAEPRLPQHVESLFQQKIADVHMLPAIAMQAMDIAKNPDCSIGEFAAVVERDVKLASDILGMANSALYSPGKSIDNLHQAVVRLGFRQCKNLIVSASLTSMMKSISLEEEWIRELLWRHAFLVGMLELHLNRALNIGFQGEEFTAGLIHDFGRTLFAVCLPDQFVQIDPLQFEESAETLAYERSVVGTDHCEVGAWFAVANRLPESLVSVVRFHHQPAEANSALRLTALTAVADHMANFIQRHESADGYEPATNSAIVLLEGAGVRCAGPRFNEICRAIMEASVRDVTEMMAF